MEHLQQRGASTAFDPNFASVLTEFKRNVTSVWGGVNGRTDRQLVQVNVRVDKYSDVGSATTGLVSYGYKLTPEWRAIAQVSNAFRAPSFSDLYYPFFGNPQLEPEKSRSGELGLHYVAGRTTMRAALYRTDTRDLIVYEPATQRAENVDRARATGVEAGASGRVGHWEWSGNVNVVRAVNAETDERLLRRAPYVVNAGARVRRRALARGLRAFVRRSARRPRHQHVPAHGARRPTRSRGSSAPGASRTASRCAPVSRT